MAVLRVLLVARYMKGVTRVRVRRAALTPAVHHIGRHLRQVVLTLARPSPLQPLLTTLHQLLCQ